MLYKNMRQKKRSLWKKIEKTIRYIRKGEFKNISELFKPQFKMWDSEEPPHNVLILAPLHTHYVARQLQNRLKFHGIAADITTQYNKKKKYDLHIVLAAQTFPILPPIKNTIIFQLEQTVSDERFDKKYIDILKRYDFIVDYSMNNIEFLIKKIVPYNKIFYLPIGATEKENNTEDPIYDFVFYGNYLSSARRCLFLDELSKHYTVKICKNLFDDELSKVLKKAKFILNIHYYENALLETPRIFETLSFGIPILSENSADKDQYPELEGSVTFFEKDSIQDMLDKAKECIQNHEKKRGYINNTIEISRKRFSFMFDQILAEAGILCPEDIADPVFTANSMFKTVKQLTKTNTIYSKNFEQFNETDSKGEVYGKLDRNQYKNTNKKGTFLFVSHNGGGGTSKHIKALSDLLHNIGINTLFCTINENEEHVVSLDIDVLYLPKISKRFDMRYDMNHFTKALSSVNTKHIHIHHLAGFPAYAGDFFRIVAQKLEIQYDITVHDYLPICPRINLVDGSNLYCGEPQINECEKCIKINCSLVETSSVWSLRDNYLRLFQNSRKVFVPDIDVKQRLEKYFSKINFIIQPNEIMKEINKNSFSIKKLADNALNNFNVVILGAISDVKGLKIIKKAVKYSSQHSLPIKFKLVGHTYDDNYFKEYDNISLTGQYTNPTAILDKCEADISWFPAIWPETYSFTLSETLASGIYPVAFDIGALATRIKSIDFGELLPIEYALNSQTLCHSLLSACKHSRKVEKKYFEFFMPENIIYKYYDFLKNIEP